MSITPKQVYSLCPACGACPAVEIHDDGRVRIGEDTNVVTLGRAEWNELVRAVKSGELDAI